MEFGPHGRKLRIGAQLPAGEKGKLVEFLRDHLDVFAWEHDEMPGIDPSIIEHRLNVDRNCRPVKQRRTSFASERNQAIADEVQKLIKAEFIREVDYPEWLANVVLVKKANGKWRMCVDFTDLNKACPKDSFSLPRIDQLVDSTAGHEVLSFMDAFSGYNQIRMAESDQEKTSFTIDRGLYCYTVMPFGLKNAGATYQRLVNKMFQTQIGRNMEVYVDDMLVKSLTTGGHVADLAEAFGNLRRYRMKLNPQKCVFGVDSGKFLGFMVSHRGIEANPDKVKAILEMPSPRTMKQLQRLTGRLAALSRFVSRSSDKCLPFFRVLKKAFSWTEECERAFAELKTYLANPPLLSRPAEGEILYLYLAVSRTGVSSVLVREESGKQRPVYFTSKVLHGAEERYPRIEKLAYALVISARRLRPYFQAHAVRVLTEYPLRKVLQKPDLSGRLVNWAIELGEFDIEYHPRTATKAQALADFVVEMGEGPDEEGSSKGPTWVAYVDGSSTGEGSGAGVVLRGPDQEELRYALKFDFPATNNEAEYEAVLSAMEIARQMGITDIEIRSDSRVVVEQVNGSYAAQETRMSKCLEKVHQFYSHFHRIVVVKIPREKIGLADALSRIGSGSDPVASVSGCKLLIKAHPTAQATEELMQVGEADPEWATEIVRYLRTGGLPPAKEEAQRIVRHSARYILVGGTLYRRGVFSSFVEMPAE